MAKKNYENLCKVDSAPRDVANREETALHNERLKQFQKSNIFIQNYIAKMSSFELKIADYIMANAYKDMDSPLEYTFRIVDFCKVAGFDYDSGEMYEQVRSALLRMRDKAEWGKTADGLGETTIALINKARIYRKTGLVHLWLDEDMRQYVFEAKKAWEEKGIPYSKMMLLFTMPLTSRYARLLYEQLKSWQSAGEHYWTVSQLQEILGSNYTRYADFKRKVLDISVRQINEFTDINVDYEPTRVGRSYEYITFFIEPKSNTDQLKAMHKNQYLLDGVIELKGQTSMFEV